MGLEAVKILSGGSVPRGPHRGIWIWFLFVHWWHQPLCVFLGGLNAEPRARLPGDGPWGRLQDYVEWLIVHNGSLFNIVESEKKTNVPPTSTFPVRKNLSLFQWEKFTRLFQCSELPPWRIPVLLSHTLVSLQGPHPSTPVDVIWCEAHVFREGGVLSCFESVCNILSLFLICFPVPWMSVFLRATSTPCVHCIYYVYFFIFAVTWDHAIIVREILLPVASSDTAPETHPLYQNIWIDMTPSQCLCTCPFVDL